MLYLEILQFLDKQYSNLCFYDEYIFTKEKRLHPNNKSSSDIANPNQVLTVSQLYNMIIHYLKYAKQSSTITRRIFTTRTSYYLLIDTNYHDYFITVQLILALNCTIPILLDNPLSVFWNNQIFKRHGRDNRFKCTYCSTIIEYCEDNDCFIAPVTLNHKHPNCSDYR